ncbi:iron-containing alcohol dehydrogenase family protein [Neisseria sp. Ec49-e6-T10]|uniref:iron-containing alcohol dehydrogenase family protein n=1 Tax=Neisseria sp. Ec49-e6-T10 TaxID=3140744 RepID=UPI003EBDCAD6
MLKEQDVGQVVYRALDLMNARAVKEFSLPSDTYMGAGAVACMGEALAARGISRVFIVIDEIVDKLALAEAMFRSLATYNIGYVIYTQPPGEPESIVVEDAARKFTSSNCNGMIAIGGGSALDSAKAIAMLAANTHLDVAGLLNAKNITHKRAPLIAVPTTAGTGSEATNVTVITDSVSLQKRVIAHADLIPDLAIIDACLMLQLPSEFTAATGVDALTHAIEAYVAKKATPLTRALAYQALRMIGESLTIATGQGDNIEARESMALASYMAGVAFSNAGLGLTHAMAHQIGANYKIPHGVANAIMLPSIMDFNELVCKRDFSDIGLSLTGEIMSSKEVIQFIQGLIIDLGLPRNLAVAGGKEEDFETMAKEAMKDYCLPTNPRSVSQSQIVQVYRHAFNR